MCPVWSRPLRISPHLQFLFDNAPAADPAQVVNVTCGGPHIENISAGRKNESEYGRRFIFCILKQCGVWKHWLREPLTPSEKATLRAKEREWQSRIKAVRSKQSTGSSNTLSAQPSGSNSQSGASSSLQDSMSSSSQDITQHIDAMKEDDLTEVAPMLSTSTVQIYLYIKVDASLCSTDVLLTGT
ncbi:hypothetical protein PILCRDRAFT_14862 [Piloderma croceum F 1598]|uniref:Uncharacterized protein n=1 Tax=Piloderma croceum (strain F 1598) TaxID=765440 RepID=A0A0C3B961_PILCF|nr:hypothetical protein PILCRDRAFT_14862 [Piloderma croceum F 1598]